MNGSVLITQAFSFDFSPKAATMKPSNPSVIVKYSVNSFQLDMLSNVIMNSTYRIDVSAFRRRLPVSDCNYFVTFLFYVLITVALKMITRVIIMCSKVGTNVFKNI